jgi:hypothetical protein
MARELYVNVRRGLIQTNSRTESKKKKKKNTKNKNKKIFKQLKHRTW